MNANDNMKKTTFAALRAEIDAGLSRMEKAGESLDAAAVHLIKLGAVLACATAGPEETIEGLKRQIAQLSEAFPGDGFPPVQGSA